MSREGRLSFEHLHERVERAFLAKGRPPGQRFVEDCPERIDVAAFIDLIDVSRGLLGRHVVRRADDRAGPRGRRFAAWHLGQTEIADVGSPRGVEQNVRRLEVAMHEPR